MTLRQAQGEVGATVLTDRQIATLVARCAAQLPIGERDAKRLLVEVVRLSALINSPETEDFMKAIPLEAAHQVERWGADHDKGKTAWDWFWVTGYLSQKAAAAMAAGDLDKAKHHTITVAALMLTWHRHLKGGVAENEARP